MKYPTLLYFWKYFGLRNLGLISDNIKSLLSSCLFIGYSGIL